MTENVKQIALSKEYMLFILNAQLSELKTCERLKVENPDNWSHWNKESCKAQDRIIEMFEGLFEESE